MTLENTAREIDAAAAEWFARVELGSLSVSEEAEFKAWLAASPRHYGAYARAQAFASAADQALSGKDKLFGPQMTAIASSPLISRRNFVLASGAAAAAAVAAIAVKGDFDVAPVIYRTKRGEVHTLPLADGSLVTLNTESAIEVAFKRTERAIRLRYGEVLFDVAKDRSRPFTVTTGNTVVRAVGTSFVVRDLKDQPVQVLVREGIVDVVGFQYQEQNPLRLMENSRVVALEGAHPSLSVDVRLNPVEVERQLAWRDGMISLEDQSLQDAVFEFNRYSQVQIIIDDPEISGLAVTGLFSLYNPVGFSQSVATVLGLHVEVTSDKIRLSR